jgi:MFS family permease
MTMDSPVLTQVTPARAGAGTFGILFLLESFTRSLNAGVLSIQAHDLLGSSQRVSVLSTSVACAVLTATLLMPFIIGAMRRRYAYSLGIGLLAVSSLVLATFTVPGQIVGLFLRNAGVSIVSVTLSLYILDHIKKTGFARAESMRMSMATASWMAGPYTGVWLYTQYGPMATQAAVFVASMVLLAAFWYLRLTDPNTLPSGKLPPFNPIKNVRRFVRQPRLRLAWAIAFGRSCYWATLFIYGPLLMLEGHLGKQAGGILVSLSQAVLAATFLYGMLAARIGVRGVLAGCFAVVAVCAIAAGLAGKEMPLLAGGFLLAGALAATGLDGVGGVPFLRAVKSHERQRMTPVYRTFIDFSELIPGFVFAIALSYFSINSVFIILGCFLIGLSYLSWRYVPRSM